MSLNVGQWQQPYHALTQWIHMYVSHIGALVTICENKLTTGGTAQIPPSCFIIMIIYISIWQNVDTNIYQVTYEVIMDPV